MDCNAILRAKDRPRELDSLLGASVGEQSGLIVQVASQTAAMLERIPRNPPWIGYLTVDRATDCVVGGCGFKTAPVDAAIEIAYFTFPAFERRGLACAAAAELIAIARSSGAIRTVVAHTLPTANASTRVLRRNGFRFTGEVVDSEDGLVWRWELNVTGKTD